MYVELQLTDDTPLRAHGFVVDRTLFAEIQWGFSLPNSRVGQGTLWGSPAMLRRLAELATQAAIQAEEEACWQAHQATPAVPKEATVA